MKNVLNMPMRRLIGTARNQRLSHILAVIRKGRDQVEKDKPTPKATPSVHIH